MKKVMTSNFGMIGSLNIELFDENMKLKEKQFIDNLVVSVGKAHIIEQLAAGLQASMQYMALGTSSQGTDAGDASLVAELAGSRKLFDSKVQGTAPNDNQLTYITTWGSGAGVGAITEAGIFNASSGQYMLNRTVFDVKNKQSADTLVITWVVTIP